MHIQPKMQLALVRPHLATPLTKCSLIRPCQTLGPALEEDNGFVPTKEKPSERVPRLQSRHNFTDNKEMPAVQENLPMEHIWTAPGRRDSSLGYSPTPTLRIDSAGKPAYLTKVHATLAVSRAPLRTSAAPFLLWCRISHADQHASSHTSHDIYPFICL